MWSEIGFFLENVGIGDRVMSCRVSNFVIDCRKDVASDDAVM